MLLAKFSLWIALHVPVNLLACTFGEFNRTSVQLRSLLKSWYWVFWYLERYLNLSKLSSFLFLEYATSYVVHRATSMWSSLMTMNGMKTVIIYSLETIYQTLINLKASFQGNEVIDDIKSSILLFSMTTIYSRTSRKRPPKKIMQRLSGHLREMVTYKNLTTGGLFREEVQTHLLYGRYLLHAMSKLRHVSLQFFVYS